MPRGHEHNPIYSYQYLRALFGPNFLYVFLEKDYNGKKKDRCAVFGRNNDCLSSREIYSEVLFFSRKARVNNQRVSPEHPIILPKSNKFNMAAVSVKRFTRHLRNEKETGPS